MPSVVKKLLAVAAGIGTGVLVFQVLRRKGPSVEPREPSEELDVVEEASEESFPASDPPGPPVTAAGSAHASAAPPVPEPGGPKAGDPAAGGRHNEPTCRRPRGVP